VLLDENGHVTAESCYLESVKLTLNFLVIVWHSHAQGCFLAKSASALLRLLANKLPQETPGSLQVQSLFDTLLTALATIETLRRASSRSEFKKVWQDDALWQFALRYGRSNLVGAGEFQNTHGRSLPPMNLTQRRLPTILLPRIGLVMRSAVLTPGLICVTFFC
jgi:hypothetical protein